MRRSLAYLPTPYVAAVTVPGDGPRVVAVVDLQPVTLPEFDGSEAPAAFTVEGGPGGRRRTYRIAGGRLWAALGDQDGWTLDEAPHHIAEGVTRRIGGQRHETDREQGFLDGLLFGGSRPEVAMALVDHVIDPPAESRDDAWTALKHAENHMAVVDGRLHHEVPEPTLSMGDPGGGGAVSVDVVERRWEDVNGSGLRAFPGPDGHSWLSYPIHHAPLVSQVVARLSGEVAAKRRVTFHDPVVEVRGVPGHVVNGYKVARAEAVVAVAADVVGHATDDGILAFVELRQALLDVGADRSARGLSSLGAGRVTRLTQAMRRLHEAFDPWRSGELGALARRAALVSTVRDAYEERLARAD